MKAAPAGGVVLLENLRFHPEEEKNDAGFAAELAKLADVYVNDAFGAAHRAHASVEALVHLMPQAGAGLLMETELRYLVGELTNPQRPFVAVLGGAKVSDKIEVIDNLVPRVDRLLIGGAMAYTFLKAMGKPVGKSLVEDDKLDRPRERSWRRRPHATCRCCFRPTTSSRQSPRRARPPRPSAWTTPPSATAWAWTSGRPRRTPMPTRFGMPRPSSGTARWACSRSTPSPRARWPWRRRWQACQGISIIGGGDSIAAINKAGLAGHISHISTGGGASLELLGGLTLPGVAALPEA